MPARARRSHDSPTGAKCVTCPTPSTWLLTRWPPRRSLARSACSRLTGPVASGPAVLARLSAETSIVKRAAAASSDVTVMRTRR